MRAVPAVAVVMLAVAAPGGSWAPSPARAQSTPSRACADEREAQKRSSDEINRLGREMGRTADPAAREALMEQIRRVMEQRRAVDQRLYACVREDQHQRFEEQRRKQEQRRTEQMRQREQRQREMRQEQQQRDQRQRGEPRPSGTTDLPEQRPQEGQSPPPPPPGRAPSQPKPPSG